MKNIMFYKYERILHAKPSSSQCPTPIPSLSSGNFPAIQTPPSVNYEMRNPSEPNADLTCKSSSSESSPIFTSQVAFSASCNAPISLCFGRHPASKFRQAWCSTSLTYVLLSCTSHIVHCVTLGCRKAGPTRRSRFAWMIDNCRLGEGVASGVDIEIGVEGGLLRTAGGPGRQED